MINYFEDASGQTMVLTARQLTVLRALVEEYVRSAQPVSSTAIADFPGIQASPATVRNEMAHLEELGLLYQPHTSAGRVPTDLGYRCFVNHLMTEYRQQQGPPQVIPRLDPGVEATCRLLGELTRYTALALVPGWHEQRLRHIELAPVGDDQLLVMLVTDDHQVLHSLSTVQLRPDPSRLRQLNDLLNIEFGGKLLSELTDEAVVTAINKLTPRGVGEFFRQTPELVRRGLPAERSGARMYVEGTTHIFEQLEFAEMPKLRALMEALHEESLFESLFANSQPGEIKVSIGTENPHAGLEDCAVVFTSYEITEHATGRIGVLGPKRMQYRQVIGAVDAVVQNLDRRFKQKPS